MAPPAPPIPTPMLNPLFSFSTLSTAAAVLSSVRKLKAKIQFYFVVSYSTSQFPILLRFTSQFPILLQFYSIVPYIPIKDVVDGFQFQYATKIRNPTRLETSR